MAREPRGRGATAVIYRAKGMLMKFTGLSLLLSSILLSSLVVAAQQKTETAPQNSRIYEFPVTMRQKVVAGSTLVGTKVQAKLIAATLVDGVVVPKDAILSGQVTESIAKSDKTGSLLGIRMDSAEWKNGSTPLKAYLTAWTYPLRQGLPAQDLSYGPPEGPVRTWNGAGTYPDPNSPASHPFPGGTSDREPDYLPQAPSTGLSSHPVQMKDVELMRDGEGNLAISSTHTLKLDKGTIYVIATGDQLPAKLSR